MAVHSHLPPYFLTLTSYHQSSKYNSCFSFHSILQPKFTHYNAKINNSIVCLAYTKKSRPSRKIMSDEELCCCLKEFVASVGLPEGHVPSTKELTEHGRNNLANIVRRRGHKLIAELLANPSIFATDEVNSWKNLNGELSGSTDLEEIGQEEKVSDAVEESTDLINDESVVDANLMANSESAVYSDIERPVSVETPVSLQDKVEGFMKYGQLDAVDDDEENLGGHELLTQDERKLGHFTNDTRSGTGSNGTLMIGRSISPPSTEERYTSEIQLSTQSEENTDFNVEMSSETTQASKMDNEDEINRLKLVLLQKESELSRLKEEIEKEKKELSVLQTKAEDEISKAHKLITEKEAELLAVEESLSGLVEAKIQYSGDGQIVEVAGSFNGWHQRIKMDLQISSVIVDPADSRMSKLWSATLWLYPGVYEMKFIVDGQWKIDQQREITIKNGVENNILRVHR